MKKTSSLEKHIGYWLRFVSNHVSLAFANELASYDISVAEWVVLNQLSEQMQSPAVIAKIGGLTRGAASKVLDKLFDKQLIERAISSEDRRYQEISLSNRGKAILPKLRAIADQNDDKYFGHLSKSEKDQMMKLLTGIVARNKWKDIPIN
jgi:DNA-binding MarR family transcriptional regulator